MKYDFFFFVCVCGYYFFPIRAREVAALLYDDAIETVLTLRDVAPALFFEGSELMGLGAELLAQAEALPGLQAPREMDDEIEDARLQEELHMFYELHPIAEGDEEFEEDEEDFEDTVEGRRESGACMNFDRRKSRESKEFNPDDIGSARDSYDSDEYVTRSFKSFC
jgi:hypothetical protein